MTENTFPDGRLLGLTRCYMYQSTVNNDEIMIMPQAAFGGTITVVDTEDAMVRAAEVLAAEKILGYDTETRPAFQKGKHYKTALLQLSTADEAFLFRLNMIQLSEKMVGILQSDKILKVGAAIRDDIKGMQKHIRFTPKGFIDLQQIVGQYGIEELSVRKMSAIVLGMRVSKAQRLSNWEAANLTDAQQSYAAIDAWVCREIYVKLTEIK